MPNPYTDVRLVRSELSLAQFKTFLREREANDRLRIMAVSATNAVWQQEHGPVHPATMVTVINEAPPESPVEVIEYQTPAPPPVPAGKTLVCIGHCYIGGVDSNVLVYR